jgi:hypothetical protein
MIFFFFFGSRSRRKPDKIVMEMIKKMLYIISLMLQNHNFAILATLAQCNEVCYLFVLISDTNITYMNRGKFELEGGSNFVGKLIHTGTVNHRHSEIDYMLLRNQCLNKD